ncbi:MULTISPECIES: peptide-methionine (S)-S-oxide reductase MsrA [Erysipelothrix]|uniref:peptide-methionine (S)-S-oxide reductase MsrA n=1 Tax=Erysipelothrix TaxID=1647 RepID=UPI0013779244|nr:peptide-methionine (S)-S-oxide reductase MsrA [Erysipelothrix sp. strain 2 (EsS2-6-Brazil)]MBK2402693.1 peptide-methionine (S)-S-oxide reductase [Erysipelothrix sp. strain 2 (EsS2-6-Brazil)]NBA01621.1 peptide-methionine (S)-S-oxide reductase MsrA [Erysipelothrix rhusiopathiae]
MRNPYTRELRTIFVAGGCFWGVQEYYKRLKGIENTAVGYANSNQEDISYRDVCSGNTGAVEAVMIQYNHAVISLDAIVDHLFRIIDPTSLNKQGNDIGTQYRTGIYFEHESDHEHLESLLIAYQEQYSKPLAVEVLPLLNFTRAEEEHQDYLEMNPGGYCHIDFSRAKKTELKEQQN